MLCFLHRLITVLLFGLSQTSFAKKSVLKKVLLLKMNPPIKKYYTLVEAGRVLGIGEHRMRLLAKKGLLTGERSGKNNQWRLSEEEISRLKKMIETENLKMNKSSGPRI
jgi:hypothetical protein